MTSTAFRAFRAPILFLSVLLSGVLPTLVLTGCGKKDEAPAAKPSSDDDDKAAKKKKKKGDDDSTDDDDDTAGDGDGGGLVADRDAGGGFAGA